MGLPVILVTLGIAVARLWVRTSGSI